MVVLQHVSIFNTRYSYRTPVYLHDGAKYEQHGDQRDSKTARDQPIDGAPFFRNGPIVPQYSLD